MPSFPLHLLATISARAQTVHLLRYGLGFVACLLFQALLLKSFVFFKGYPRRRLLLVALFFANALLLVVPLDYFLGLTLPGPLYRALVLPAVVYQGVSGIFVVAYLVVRWSQKWWPQKVLCKQEVRLSATPPPISLHKRRFIVATGVTTLGALPLLRALYNAAADPKVVHNRYRFPTAPREGLRVVHVTDLHVGYFFGPRRVARLRDQINALAPDLILFTGDQLHNDHLPFLDQLRENIGGLKSTYGAYQVAGNHDHRLGKERLFAALAPLGIHPLDNDGVIVHLGETTMAILGVDDLNYGGDLPATFTHRGAADFTLLLSHRPRALQSAAREGVDLVLAGHTHGGQICLGSLCPSLLETPYTYGRYREGKTQLFVSAGAGTTGPPMRLFAPGEIVLHHIDRGDERG